MNQRPPGYEVVVFLIIDINPSKSVFCITAGKWHSFTQINIDCHRIHPQFTPVWG